MPNISLDEYKNKIEELIDNNKLEQAANHCYYLLRQYPLMSQIYQYLGRIYLENDQFDKGFEIISRLLSVEADNFLYQISISVIYEEKGYLDEAIYHKRVAAILQPNNTEIISDLGRLLSTGHGMAIPSSFPYLSSGNKCFQSGDFMTALDDFHEAQKRGDSIYSDLLLGQTYAKLGDEDKSIFYFEKLLKKDPYIKSGLLSAACYYYGKDSLKFQRIYNRLTELDPDFQNYSINEEKFEPKGNSEIVNYQDWTGFPNMKLRVGWQHTDNQFIENNLNEIPIWADLIPLCKDLLPQFTSSLDKESDISGLLSTNSKINKNIIGIDESAIQKEYFKNQADASKIIEEDTLPDSIKFENKPSESNPVSALDQAFSWLEKMADPQNIQNNANNLSEQQTKKEISSLTTPKIAFADNPINDKDVSDHLQKDGTSEKEIKNVNVDSDYSEKDLKLVRKAWNSFSTGDIENGIQLYKDIVKQGICSELVKDDINKLKILFPDIKELNNIL